MTEDIHHCETDDIEHTSLVAEGGRVVRYVTAAIGGYLVAHGYMEAATVELITGIIVSATPLVSGMILARLRRKHVSKVIQKLKSTQVKTKTSVRQMKAERTKGDSEGA